MATAQKLRASTKIVSPTTQQNSKTFVKQLVALAVSNLAYKRSFFPADAFIDHEFDGLKTKILTRNTECEEAITFQNWINSALIAFDEGYLKKMIICLEVENTEELLESYTFSFIHGNNGFEVTSENSSKKSIILDMKKITEDYKALVNATINIPSPEPFEIYDSVQLFVKLLYYDEATPPDYEPEGYHKAEYRINKYRLAINNEKQGMIATSWHRLRLCTRTLKKQKNAEKISAEGLSTVISAIKEKPLIDNVEKVGNSASDLQPLGRKDENKELYSLCDHTVSNGWELQNFPEEVKEATIQLMEGDYPELMELADKTLAECNKDPQQIEALILAQNAALPIKSPDPPVSAVSKSSLISPSGSVPELSVEVKCVCQMDTDDVGELVIICSSCHQPQHSVCYGILGENIPPEFYCVSCNGERNLCTDQQLVKMEESVRRAKCIYRRVLAHCLKFQRINMKAFARDLCLPDACLESVVRKLEADGILSVNRRGRGSVVRMVNTENLRNVVLPKHFRDLTLLNQP